MSSQWKYAEKKGADLVGGVRNLNRGSNFSSSEPDVISDTPFTVECKYRKKLPKCVTGPLEQAKRYNKNKTPIAYMRERYKHEGIVMMYESDFKEWFGDLIKRSVI